MHVSLNSGPGIPKLLLLLLLPLCSQAQKNLKVSFTNEAISLPTIKALQTPIHPGIKVGSDFIVKGKNNWKQTVGADLSFFHHRLSENALMLDATYAIGYKFRFGLQPKFLSSLGYKHSLPVSEVYKLDNGVYKKASFFGKSQVNAKIGLGLEYPVNKKLSITADYQTMVAMPYSQKLPFSLHTFLSMGIKVNFKQQ
ncbi:hypothetical protein CLV98_11315 [Dyadobacter jejuensis]|uniref:Outer membrane protein with beta-barrel domain n=1 Tax=Dyadobacter jejuensis TaxID=1082580 RepID=A0A316ADV9_9BACT|nr:hypothetical protein [Dyadobacter jejuensis]PWJ55539.1 hypothetical protein CLV98_11315 [Dyadobacter jejuensis]